MASSLFHYMDNTNGDNMSARFLVLQKSGPWWLFGASIFHPSSVLLARDSIIL